MYVKFCLFIFRLAILIGSAEFQISEDSRCKEKDYDLLKGLGTNVKSCDSFTNSPCLCELLGNCKYEDKTGLCLPKFDCFQFNDRAALCRSEHCYYDCASGLCSDERFGSLTSGCIASAGQCTEHCGNICFCKQSGCQYSSDGFCRNSNYPKDCENNQFKPYMCKRESGFYLQNGKFCKNRQQSGLCDIEKTVFGVNFGGLDFVDSQTIKYAAETKVIYDDTHEIRLGYKLNTEGIELTDDQSIYKTLIYANPNKRENGRCIAYLINICDNGVYEMSIKTMEISDVWRGEKTFNVKMGGQTVIAEIDLMSLEETNFVPIEIILTLEVVQDVILIDGQIPVKIENGTVSLEFCYGECMFLEGSFQIASLSVVKLKDERERELSKCSKFSGSPWDCTNARCSYNYTTGLCGLKNQTCTIQPWGSNCRPERPLEMLFLVDSNGTPDTQIFDTFQSLAYLPRKIQARYPQSIFGISLFAEFACSRIPCDEGACCTPKPGDTRPRHDEQDGCYRTHLPLTQNVSSFEAKARTSELTVMPDPGILSQWFALMMGGQDLKMKWNSSKCPNATKILVLLTDELTFHYDSPKPYSREASFDGNDNCYNTKHPSVYALRRFLAQEGFALFSLVRGDKLSTFQNMFNYLKVTQEIYPNDLPVSEIEDKLFQLIEKRVEPIM